MNDFVRVQVVHRIADLFHETCARTLRQHKVFINHSLEQFAPLNSEKHSKSKMKPRWLIPTRFLQLHEAIKFVFEIKRIVNLYNRRVIQARENVDLHLHHLLVLLLLITDNLNSELQSRCFLLTKENCSKASTSKLRQYRVRVRWIIIAFYGDWSIGERRIQVCDRR